MSEFFRSASKTAKEEEEEEVSIDDSAKEVSFEGTKIELKGHLQTPLFNS